MAFTPTIWLAPSADKRLEVFAVGVSAGSSSTTRIALLHIWQTAINNGWSDWKSHGELTAELKFWSSPAIAPSADGRLELFMIYGGTLRHIWQTAPNNGWSDWKSHGAPTGVLFGYRPALAASADGRLELFVVGNDGVLWHIWQTAPNNGWSDWTSHGSPAGSGGLDLPCVIAPSKDGRLEVFCIGKDGQLWHIWQTAPSNGWSDWTSHGKPPGVDLEPVVPTVAPSADGRLELFVIGKDKALWHIWQTVPNNGWSDWTSHGSPPGVKIEPNGPEVAASADGRLELFAVGDDGALWHIWQTAPNNGWSDWRSHGRPPSADGGLLTLWGSPGLSPSADGRLELFVVASNTELWHIWQTAPNNGWSDWQSRGRHDDYGFFGAGF